VDEILAVPFSRLAKITPFCLQIYCRYKTLTYVIKGAGPDNFFQNHEISKGLIMKVNLHSKKDLENL
jgi:hypothetical protein